MKILSRSIIIVLIVLAVIGSAFAMPMAKEIVDPATLNNMGYYTYENGQFRLAEKLFLKAIDLDPVYENARLNLAVLYNEESRYGDAAEQMTALTGIDSGNVQYWYDLGANQIANFRFGTQNIDDFYAGIASYESAAMIDSSYGHIAENLAVLYNIKSEFGL